MVLRVKLAPKSNNIVLVSALNQFFTKIAVVMLIFFSHRLVSKRQACLNT